MSSILLCSLFTVSLVLLRSYSFIFFFFRMNARKILILKLTNIIFYLITSILMLITYFYFRFIIGSLLCVFLLFLIKCYCINTISIYEFNVIALDLLNYFWLSYAVSLIVFYIFLFLKLFACISLVLVVIVSYNFNLWINLPVSL